MSQKYISVKLDHVNYAPPRPLTPGEARRLALTDEELNRIKAPPTEELPKPHELELDNLMRTGLLCIWQILKAVRDDVKGFMPQRESVMNLKDCMTMLESLKKRELEDLDKLSDEELKRLAEK